MICGWKCAKIGSQKQEFDIFQVPSVACKYGLFCSALDRKFKLDRRMNLWEFKKLDRKKQKEHWYRINGMSNLWDGAFLYEADFESLR